LTGADRRPRALVVVTGSELVRGERTDLNGPFLARELLERGLEAARVTIVGDRPDELEAALHEGLEADLCLVSGGLGPTHDDRTIELLAKAAGRTLLLDPALEEEIGSLSRAFATRLGRPFADFEPGVRKQATLPEGARSLGLAGTAPGVLLDLGACVAVALPGPPAELQRLWARAVETEPLRRVLGRVRPPRRHLLRLFGVSESAVARALTEAGGDGNGVEVTICARDFEIHVDVLLEEGAEERGETLLAGLRSPLERYLFAEDGEAVEALVLARCRARGLTLATAESCTGGLVAARLTSVPGSSDVFRGGVVAYSDASKRDVLRVPGELLRSDGAVSAAVAEAMAAGAREHLGADIGVSVTGVAGPAGGTAEKPVGLVFVHAVGPEGGRGVELAYPADRDSIRRRATTTALHLVRRVLEPGFPRG